MARKEKIYSIYILASKARGVLHIWFTSNLAARIVQYRGEEIEGFTRRYRVHRLVYYETVANPLSGIQREKRLKKMESHVEDPIDREA
ncbi:MAG: GIY-YIG nuclease family protein [Candidatus Kryptoniota bacterium]